MLEITPDHERERIGGNRIIDGGGTANSEGRLVCYSTREAAEAAKEAHRG